jgi:rhamnosyltransferase
MRMRILGVITSFFPNIDELEKNINSFLEGIEHLIIWENTPKEKSNIDKLIGKLNSTKIEVRTTGHNEYLAVPFNLCAKFASDNGFTHILTMDQDSCFVSNQFEKYINLVDKHFEENVAVYGSNNRYTPKSNNSICEVNSVILSGSIFPVKSFNKLDGFNEELVIDAIDTEYCYRAIVKNYKIILMSEINLEHQIGYRHKHWSGLTLVPYSAQRTYYYLRNTFWIWEKYPEYYKESYKKSFVKYRVVYRCLKIVFEKDSVRKLKAIFFSIKHYKEKRLGRFDKFCN